MKRTIRLTLWLLGAGGLVITGAPLFGPALNLDSYRVAMPLPGGAAALRSGQHLNVVTQCEAADEPIVLIHGLPGGAAQMTPLARALCNRGYRTVHYDRMGWGHSSARRCEPATVEQNALELVEMLDVMGIDRAHIVGYSYGGAVLQEVARMAPARIRSAVLLASVGPARTVARSGFIQSVLFSVPSMRWALSSRFTAMAAAGGTFEALFHPDAMPPQQVDAQLATLAQGRTVVTWINESAAARQDYRTLQPGYLRATPVLIIHGIDDQIVDIEVARDLRQSLPHARFEPVPGAGHGMVMTRPDTVADRIAKFLEST
jgi:pimeloyl-ACP methyl ester carboxylesterase